MNFNRTDYLSLILKHWIYPARTHVKGTYIESAQVSSFAFAFGERLQACIISEIEDIFEVGFYNRSPLIAV